MKLFERTMPEGQVKALIAEVGAHRLRDTAHLFRQFADALELGEFSKDNQLE